MGSEAAWPRRRDALWGASRIDSFVRPNKTQVTGHLVTENCVGFIDH